MLHGNNKSVDELAGRSSAGVGTDRRRLASTSSTASTPCTPRSGPRPRSSCASRRASRPTPTSTSQTGQDDSKFGFGLASGAAARRSNGRRVDAVDLVGLHAHIGSNVFAVESFAKAASVMAELRRPLDLPELTLGGGLGVAYVDGEEAPTITEWASGARRARGDIGAARRSCVEPGRAIVAAAAVTLYTVGTIKDMPGIRTYVAVDGGMSDNPRPVLYGSGYEAFLPARDRRRPRPSGCASSASTARAATCSCTTPRCPTTLAVGDVLATPVTGAYGHSMGSNYNKVPRPPWCSSPTARPASSSAARPTTICSPPTWAEQSWLCHRYRRLRDVGDTKRGRSALAGGR